MKQVYFSYDNQIQFRHKLEQFKESHGRYEKNMYFQILSPLLSESVILEIGDILLQYFPDTVWLGNSTSDNIINCETHTEIVIVANIFELPSSRFKILQYDMSKSTPSEIAREVIRETRKNEWVKAIEVYWTITDFSTTKLCDDLHMLRKDIQVFGGIVCSTDITSDDSSIFSSIGGYCNKGIQLILLGGEDFHVEAIKISGWKTIGRNFIVTKARGSVLYELGGIPAYDVYKKYLNIKNDKNFFYNALDFPMMYEHNGTTIARAPSHSNSDGSITLSSDVETGSILRLSYGDPATILHDIYESSQQIARFAPDVLHIFSCAARKAYWKPYEPTYEIQALKGLCQISGFFSHGEFIRENGYVNQHNITLVIASMREGEAGICRQTAKQDLMSSGRLPLAARMATFIRETSYELEEINSTLKTMNRQLEGLAVTDSLTGLKNRLSFNNILHDIETRNDSKDRIMLMMDVNGLKYTNDTFGHPAGDELIISSGKIIQNVFGKEGYCFRIGGDEFAVITDVSPEKLTFQLKEFYRQLQIYNQSSLYRLSVSLGSSHYLDHSRHVKSISDWKLDADLNMYKNKALSRQAAMEDPELQNHKELINCMISIEEAKDPYTAHHSERVAELSESIASLLGLTASTIQLIRDAAHLHDIGKVGISDSILMKPSTLTREEFERIKEHPIIGARILMQSNYTQELVQIVLHHHERYDGTGYPEYLKGLDIPIGARIVALADSIDAMTSKRVYRDALSLDECYAEIRDNLGKYYDPAIGKICLENWNVIENIVMNHLKR